MSKGFRHYQVLDKQLRLHVDDHVRKAILAGMDHVQAGSEHAVRAQWAVEVMRRMDSLLDPDTRVKVREGCACVLSNEASVYARTFRRLRKQHGGDTRYIEEVVKYLNGTTPLRRCGEVTRRGDRIYSVIGRHQCGCSVVRKGLTEPISMTWCHCCKGSLLSVYKHVFPDKACQMDIVRTVVTGADECCFVTTYHAK